MVLDDKTNMAEEEASQRAPQVRKDTVNNRWVVFSPARSRRPSDFKSKSASNPDTAAQSNDCPFCIGHEHMCAPEIFRSPLDSPDWKIRVIQNLYPALSRDVVPSHKQNQESDTNVPDLVVSGFGFHDVVIETPVHSVQLWDQTPVQVGDVLLAYKKRIQQLQSIDSIQYIQVFKNHGASAGASLSHPHSQIIALPIVPPAVSTRTDSMKELFEQTGKCRLCEAGVKDFLVDESTHFISIVPFAATFPFELWIIPRNHSSHFSELDDDQAVDLGWLLKLLLSKIYLQLNNPPFNFMVHTAPLHSRPSILPYTHWYIQIVPQLTTVGGFEVGTGCYINPVFPEDAAKVIRAVKIPS